MESIKLNKEFERKQQNNYIFSINLRDKYVIFRYLIQCLLNSSLNILLKVNL